MAIIRFFVLILALSYSHQAIALTELEAKDFSQLPEAKGCRLIDYDQVKIVPGIVNGTYFAIVSGTSHSPAADVKLSPFTYVKQPDYWGIEVIGCMNGIDFVPSEPFTLITAAHNMGTKGIEIIGAKGAKKFDIPPQ